jgi:RNA polymerase sigma-70 factor (ECF subfamily)
VGETGTRAEAGGLDDTVRRAQRGDQAAFEALYRAHVSRVYGLCLRLVADAGRAQDLTQDVFVRAWEKLATFRGDSAFSSWLYRLAVNLVLGDRRAAGRRDRRLTGFDDLPDHAAVAAPTPPPGLAIELDQAIAALPPGARAVFVLHDVEGYEHGEIAAITGIAVGTSKAHLFRARRLLRKWLDR